MMKNTLHEWNGYDFLRSYRFAGFGKDGESVYMVLETKYSIAEGVVYRDKFVGHCNSARKPAILVRSA